MRSNKVVFVDEELEESFNSLSDDDPIKRGILRALKSVSENVFSGRNVKKELIPKKLIDKYGINNLWIYDLPNGWRLLYSVTSDGEVELIAAVLDWMDHKEYERLFGY
jgi:hypothetical protein